MTVDTTNNNNSNNDNNNNKKVTTTTTTVTVTTNTATNLSAPNCSADSATTTTTTNTIIELSENFYINNKRKNNVQIQVKLNAIGIYLRRKANENDQVNEQHIRIEDIIGSRCGPRLKKRARGGLISCKSIQDDEHTANEQEKSTTNTAAAANSAENSNKTGEKDLSAYLYIYAYVKREKPLRRVQTVRILRFRTNDSYEENLKSAERWHHGIRVNKSQGKQMERKHMLVLLNPKSGSGKGREMFQKQVAPVLKEAEVQYDLLVTTHANFARELVRSKRDLLHRYSGIVVASGDGLFYEVLNGLMERADWRLLSRKMPIGIIPCGSGNGLAKSIAHCFNEPYEPKPILNATLACVSGNTALMDIVRVEVARGEKHVVMWSFLSVGWGLIADIDIESERLRSIGAQRFTIWSIHRLISLRTYKGKLSYLPWTESTATAANIDNSQSTTAEDVIDSSHNANADEFHDLDNIDDDNENDENDEFTDAISLDGTTFHRNADSWHSASSRRTAYYSIAGQSIRSNQSMAASMYSKIEAANAELEQRAPTTTIPALNVPLTDEQWHHEEGDYVMVHAAYTTHLATDCLFAPNAQLNDGIIYLIIIRGGVGRSQLLQFLLNMSTGTHLPEQPNDYINVVPVRAFRIVPNSDDGIMTVDGERVDYGPIQGEIFPGMINVMVPHNSTTMTDTVQNGGESNEEERVNEASNEN